MAFIQAALACLIVLAAWCVWSRRRGPSHGWLAIGLILVAAGTAIRVPGLRSVLNATPLGAEPIKHMLLSAFGVCLAVYVHPQLVASRAGRNTCASLAAGLPVVMAVCAILNGPWADGGDLLDQSWNMASMVVYWAVYAVTSVVSMTLILISVTGHPQARRVFGRALLVPGAATMFIWSLVLPCRYVAYQIGADQAQDFLQKISTPIATLSSGLLIAAILGPIVVKEYRTAGRQRSERRLSEWLVTQTGAGLLTSRTPEAAYYRQIQMADAMATLQRFAPSPDCPHDPTLMAEQMRQAAANRLAGQNPTPRPARWEWWLQEPSRTAALGEALVPRH